MRNGSSTIWYGARVRLRIGVRAPLETGAIHISSIVNLLCDGRQCDRRMPTIVSRLSKSVRLSVPCWTHTKTTGSPSTRALPQYILLAESPPLSLPTHTTECWHDSRLRQQSLAHSCITKADCLIPLTFPGLRGKVWALNSLLIPCSSERAPSTGLDGSRSGCDLSRNEPANERS